MSTPYLIPYSSVVIDFTSEPLGKGGFGIVRKGTWCGSPVAVKVLKDLTLTKKELDDFTKEARTNHAITKEATTNHAIPRHTNILAFFGIINEPGHYALVMELMPKGSLFDLIDSGKSLAWDERRRIARDTACGMMCLHAGNVLHCDLKSLNVLLAGDGTAKVADFGLSHIRRASLSKDYHRTSGGSLPWKAPELLTLTQKPKYTKECDVFSYGITLTELFTMAGPYGYNYNELDPDILLALVKSGERTRLPSDIPDDLLDLAQHCWAHDPKQRPPFSRIVKQFDISGSAPVYHSARDELLFTPPLHPPTNSSRNNPAAQFPILTATPPPKSAPTSSSESAASVVNTTELEKLYEMGRALDPAYGDEKSPNHTAAFECYLKAAIAGHPASQDRVGYKLQQGLGVEKNAAKAVEWFQKAAEQGHAQAQNNLGSSYQHGTGVGKDERRAVEWYGKAAKQGRAAAQSSLGYCYQNGIGVGKDGREAVEWYEKAAEQGFAIAQVNLGYCYRNGTGVAKNETMAAVWYEKAAEQGYAAAQKRLGYCYQHGVGVAKNETRAVEWYTKAAEQGELLDADVQYFLGYCYRNGIGVAEDKTRAMEWFKKAAAQGNQEAILALTTLGMMRLGSAVAFWK
ncbi:hypothetical protein HK104_003062 [Borealophlyctis nickersoniae]|nr:hypothetical protein HK104_003062 [Borealophlyctis nickersoniae]